ncbi:hypothetical protein NHJ13734_009818 [Beauveria thailandica]
MLSHEDVERVAGEFLAHAGLELLNSERLQALWADYGFIYAVQAKPIASTASVSNQKLSVGDPLESDGKLRLVLKIISPPDAKRDEGHLRKLFSYEVEQYFYDRIAPLLPPSFPVAGEKRSDLTAAQVYSAIKWLADFHGSSWSMRDDYTMHGLLLPPLDELEARRTVKELPPRSIWRNGGYTYLATRQTEYASLARRSNSEWSAVFCKHEGTASIAEKVARFLSPKGRSFEAFIHGDVKSENLFSTESGDSVAFFDFQYVGLGLGASDLAKLFTCSVPLHMLVDRSAPLPDKIAMQQGELNLLKQYHQLLTRYETTDGTKYDFSDFQRHWETALVDWCRFQASWGFWGNTDWLQGRVRSVVSDESWRNWLNQQK